MRKFTLLLLGLGFVGSALRAQKIDPSAVKPVRCGTTEAIEQRLQADPAFRAEWERNQRAGLETATAGTNSTSRSTTLTGPVNIPVIVHVVLPDPNIITDAQVDYFLNRLNIDFSGLNPDSTNAGTFMNLRGHSLIRFVRARRTPAGTLTNGVERRVGNVTIATTTYQAIKHASNGGLDPWDVTKYYNLWVGIGSGGLLGIAPNIGPGNQTETASSSIGIDGVCVDYRGFSNGCFSYPEFNLARTAVHEIGHNFGLYHSFTGCAAGADFAQITPNFTDASLYGAGADDTPGLGSATSGCPSGSVSSGCAGASNPPGKMYQNYMDYTDDACYSMFTINQVRRMHAVLEQMRPGYLTTDGAVPPSGSLALDVTPSALVAPGGSSFNNATCSSTSYPTPTCAGAVTPRVEVTNAGTSTLTSVTVSLAVNNGTPVTTTVTGLNVLTGYSTVVALPSVNLATGTNTLVFTVSAPNGGTDQNAANNTFTSTVNIAAPQAMPLTEGFESATFPPATVASVYNPTGDATWTRKAPGRNSSFAAFFDNYNNDNTNNIDELRFAPLTISGTNPVYVMFDVAHKYYPTGNFKDTLSVLVSNNCGQTWTSIYKKWGATLATAGSSSADYTNPAASDWRRDTVLVPAALLNGGTIMVAIRNTNRYGNNIFLDNINIASIQGRDLKVDAVQTRSNVCGASSPASIRVSNVGQQPITAFSIGAQGTTGAPVTQNYTGLNLLPGASTTVTFNGLPTPNVGLNALRIYGFDPVSASGTGDSNPGNDTLQVNLARTSYVANAVVEDFSSSSATAFPPAGWVVANPGNDNLTWTWSSTGNNNAGSASVRSYTATSGNNRDELVTPALTYSNVDSVTLSFDLSAASRQFPGTQAYAIDTLEILATTNCGASYTSVYKKWGQSLQTLPNNPNYPLPADFVPGAANQWRKERVDLTQFIGADTVQVVFRAVTNQGNNLYIDNVNLSSRVLPANLKANGYVIAPNPVTGGSFRIWHLTQPTTLRYVNVYDSKGALVWTKSYNKNAEQVISVDLSRQPAGVYMVSLGYEDEYRNVSERVIKQ